MPDLANSPITSVDHLKSRTEICTESLLTLPTRESLASGWESGDRRAIHQDYWGRTILDFLKGEAGHFTGLFELWEAVNNHEALTGSTRGKKFSKRHGSTMSRALQALTPAERRRSLEQAFTYGWLYDGVEEMVSLVNGNLLKREIYTGLFEDHVREGTAIIDMGSGWGRYSSLLAKRFPAASVFSGELSESGRQATQFLSERFDLGITSFDFDYQNWSGLEKVLEGRSCDRIIVFSNHSMEQVTYVDPRMFEFLLGAANDVRFIHVEPVGWQLAGGASRCRAPARSLGEHGGYNKNLLYLVQDLRDRGRIADLTIDLDFVAFGNPSNAGTKVTFCSA